MTLSITIKKVNELTGNINLFIDTVYNNFRHLENVEGIEHSIFHIRKLLDDFVGYFLICEKNKKILGYLIGRYQTLQDGRYVFFINYVFVAKKYRNHGIGTKLLNYSVSNCERNGTKFIVLISNVNNINWYLKNAFQEDKMIRSQLESDYIPMIRFIF